MVPVAQLQVLSYSIVPTLSLIDWPIAESEGLYDFVKDARKTCVHLYGGIYQIPTVRE